MGIELNSRDFLLMFLILIGFVFIMESNLSIKTHIIFGDEGFHAGMAKWIAENKYYPQWIPLGYTNVFKTNYARPPLFNIMEAGFLFLLGQHEIILKVLSPLIATLIGVVFYILVKKIYNREIGLISALILIGLPSFVTYSVLVFDEILFILYMLLFILTFMLALKENNKKYWILSAIFAGLSVLTKNAGMVILLFLPIAFIYIVLKEKKFYHHLKYFGAFFIIVLLLSGPFFLRNFALFNTPTCYRIPFLPLNQDGCDIKNFVEEREFETRNLAGGTEDTITNFGLLNFVVFTYGNYWFILIALIGGFIIFITQKNERYNSLLLIMMILIVYSIYATSNRVEDMARQTLFWSALLTIIMATYWNSIYNFLQKRQKYLGVIIIAMILFFSYQNITSKLNTMGNVKQFSPAFFEACDWVKENLPKDVIMMTFWGYRASYSCERIISPAWADIRLNDNPTDIVAVSKMHGITYFFIQKFSITQQPSRESYSLAFVQLLENNSDKFEKVYENGLPLTQCLQQGGCDGNIIYKVIY